MLIERKRWIITRKNGTEIFCGLARSYKFKPISDIGDTPIKTYLSKAKAIASFETSWWHPELENFEAVEVTETISTETKEATR